MRRGFFILLAGGAVFGCASTERLIEVPVIIEVPIYETVPVPDVLLRACKVDLSALKSNQDLEAVLGAAILELNRCTADKVAIGELE